MDQQTKAKLKQPDQFVTTTQHGLEWAGENRKSVLTTAGIVLGVIVLAVALVIVMNHREDAAAAAFGQAMQTYQAPLTTGNQPPEPGVTMYNSAKERAQAANGKFVGVADKYGMTKAGKNALYFAGITYLEEGQTQQAEDSLKKVAGSWDKDLSALAKEALADLYHQTGRDAQAIDMYTQLTNHPSDTVSAGMAQLQLADLYTAEGKTDQAHKIYAQLKDKDKDSKGVAGPAGMIAAQKLNPAAAAGPQM